MATGGKSGFFPLSFTVLIFLLIPGGCGGSNSTSPPERLIFVLAGQSNMSGRGALPDYPEPTDQRILVFGNDYQIKTASEPIDDPAGQIDTVSLDSGASYGPAMIFARTVLNRLANAYEIILIPCAKGNTSILDWQKKQGRDTLYGSCMNRVSECMQQCRSAGMEPCRLAGILFFQGETDAADPLQEPAASPSPHRWAELFSTFVFDMRNDLGMPGLPVIFAQIGSTTNASLYINWQEVQDQQASVAIPNCAMITTSDLALMDAVHFTTDSYKTIGARYADALIQMIR
jgi:hypothetical protein